MIALDFLVVAVALILLGLAVYSRLSTKSIYWPPPSEKSLQRLMTLSLFRTMFYGLVIISIYRADNGDMQPNIWLFPLAAFLTIAGIGAAIAATLVLGWANAFGAKRGLRTTGIFACSRNPIYLVTWVGQIGWALLVPQPIIIFVLFIWGLLYWIAIPLEERWLQIQYGSDYSSYCVRTPRYF